MPKLTIRKLVLITCIGGFAAAVSIGRAKDASIGAPETAAAPTAPQVCGAPSTTMTQQLVYKRYLSQTPPLRITPRRQG